MSNLQLDCGACKTESSMKATKISRFNIILRIIGFIIVIPSVVGVIFSIIMFFTTGQATTEIMSTVCNVMLKLQ
ncbi:MAG: hypothetical protein NUV76_00110 [Candidatus Kuenenia sp.]|nr:hypothetical protein [Candidatus Kuenenia sp.]